MARNSGISIGIIGCGARLRHLAGLLRAALPEARFTAVVEPDEVNRQRARAVLGQTLAFVSDHAELCADPEMRWVLIGSPNAFHREHAVAAMEAGKHVFCEKPLATTLEDCLAIRAARDATGRTFSFGLTLRYAGFYRRIRNLLDAGVIGVPISLEFNETLRAEHGGYIHGNWRRKTALAGSFLLEKCCHDVDIAGWFAGSRAARVATFGGNDFFTPANRHHQERLGPWPDGKPAFQSWDGAEMTPFNDDKDIIDNQVMIIEYDNGVRAAFHTNACSAFPERRMVLIGSEGAIRGDLVTGRIEARRLGRDEPTTVYDETGGGHGNGDEVLTEHLARTMRDGTPPLAGLEDGLAAAVTCFAADTALASGQVVDLSPFWRLLEVAAPV